MSIDLGGSRGVAGSNVGGMGTHLGCQLRGQSAVVSFWCLGSHCLSTPCGHGRAPQGRSGQVGPQVDTLDRYIGCGPVCGHPGLALWGCECGFGPNSTIFDDFDGTAKTVLIKWKFGQMRGVCSTYGPSRHVRWIFSTIGRCQGRWGGPVGLNRYDFCHFWGQTPILIDCVWPQSAFLWGFCPRVVLRSPLQCVCALGNRSTLVRWDL